MDLFREWQEQRELERTYFSNNDNPAQLIQKVDNITMRQSYLLILVIALILLAFFQGIYVIVKFNKQ